MAFVGHHFFICLKHGLIIWSVLLSIPAAADGLVKKILLPGSYFSDHWCQVGDSPGDAAQADLDWYIAHSGYCSDGISRPALYIQLQDVATVGPVGEFVYNCQKFGSPYSEKRFYGIWVASRCPDSHITDPPLPFHSNTVLVTYRQQGQDRCPANSSPLPPPNGSCLCDRGYAPNGPAATECVRVNEINHTQGPPRACQAEQPSGNPIHPTRGIKRELVQTATRAGWLGFDLTYDTTKRMPLSVPREVDGAATDAASFGDLWFSSLHKRLVVDAGRRTARASRGDGRVVSYRGDGSGEFTAQGASSDRLLSVADGYFYIDEAGQTFESYDINGALVRIDRAGGESLSFTYSIASTPIATAPGAGYLIGVADRFGRSLGFTYNTAGLVNRVIDPEGHHIAATYGANGNLNSLTWQDNKARTFLYENTSFAWALTGVVDERGLRTSTFGYDSQGRAISTERAGGVNRFSVVYATPPSIVVADVYDAVANVVWRTRTWQLATAPSVSSPNGASVDLGVALVANSPVVTTRSQPAGSGCPASASSLAYDANGNVEVEDDFNAVRVCRSHDPRRNLEGVRVEGLATRQACADVLPEGSDLPAGSRKFSTRWHPDWRLATKVAEPGRIITKVYNGQPDPFASGIARCAPAGATLPDGKPIAVLCTQVEQATSDTSGSLGFGAPLQPGVAARTHRWTYNQFGQVLTHNGPRTDVDAVTTYSYYSDTTADHTMGDLASTTNAMGKTTWFTKYNKRGQVLQSIDPSGVVTDSEFDLRGRLSSATVGGQRTTYDYDDAGQLTRVTRADESFTGYEYDAAQRLTAVVDSLGNRIEYTLDNAGNRIVESVRDAAGTLRRTLSRSFDALGRVQRLSGRE